MAFYVFIKLLYLVSACQLLLEHTSLDERSFLIHIYNTANDSWEMWCLVLAVQLIKIFTYLLWYSWPCALAAAVYIYLTIMM